MRAALDGAVVVVILLAALGVLAALRRYRAAREAFDILAEDERDHAVRLAEPPHLTVVPDGFTCQRCGENPALPAPSVWCAVCAPIVDQYPAEPIERGGLK